MKNILLFVFIFQLHQAKSQDNTTSKIAVINDVILSTSENAYTVQGFRTALDCNPQINTISFIHRPNAVSGVGNNSGELFFDVSKNGGATWSLNQGPLYNDPAGLTGARFPNGVIYNPNGNTNPNNAFLTYYAPISLGSNWSYDVFGTGNLNTLFSSTQTINTHPYANGTDLTVPDGMIITQQGQTYVFDARLTSGSFSSYDGTLQLRHGVWNGLNDMTYSTEFLSLPVDFDSNGNANYAGKCGVAFAGDGLIGYAWINGHYNYSLAPDSTYNLGVVKTTNGGLTWSNVRYILFSGTGANTVNNLLGGGGNVSYSTWNESDGVVDKNGNLHIACAIAPQSGAFGINVTPGKWGLFDVYTIDGGATWKAELLEKPETFGGFFPSTTGFITENNRAQVSRTWTGDKLFFGWIDTDTLAFGTNENINPDVHFRAFNINSGLWTNQTNVTSGLTQINGTCTFLNIAPYILSSAGANRIPCTYTKILTNVGATVEHHYLDGIEILDTDFSISGNPANLSSFLVGLDELADETFNTIGIYPNPATNEATMLINLNRSTPVLIEIHNIIGERISQINLGTLPEGQNNISLATRSLDNGIYTITVNSNKSRITKKLLINK